MILACSRHKMKKLIGVAKRHVFMWQCWWHVRFTCRPPLVTLYLYVILIFGNLGRWLGFFGTCPGISEYRFGYPLYPTHINKIIFAVKKMEKKNWYRWEQFLFFFTSIFLWNNSSWVSFFFFERERELVEILLNTKYGY